MKDITPFLWFDDQAEEAVNFYTALFPDSSIEAVSRYEDDEHGVKGEVMSISFKLNGQEFIALNGGPVFSFTPAISFFVNCESQQEVDHLWEKLTESGEEVQCGWLKDKFGVSWQIIPTALGKMLNDPDPEKAKRVMNTMLKMKKIKIDELEKAYNQENEVVK